MLMHLIRVPYFVYSLRLMFSCNLRILFIRQRNEGRSIAQHVWVVLLYNAVSEYHVAVHVATAFTPLDDAQHCNILLTECLPLPPNICITWAHILQLYFFEVRLVGSLWSWGDRGCAVSFHFCINYVLLLSSVVLCSQYRIFL